MNTELLTNPGFWIAIVLVAAAWWFGSLLKQAGKRLESSGPRDRG